MTSGVAMPAGLLEQVRKFDANAQWANRHEKALLKHCGRFVAIDDQKLLAVADTAEELRKRFKDRPTLYVTFVSPPDMAWLL